MPCRLSQIWLRGVFASHSYSQSGLRDRSVWFVAPWSDVDRNGKPYTIEAETIRQQLGLFDKISRMPAKLGARFSQGFTASIATVVSHRFFVVAPCWASSPDQDLLPSTSTTPRSARAPTLPSMKRTDPSSPITRTVRESCPSSKFRDACSKRRRLGQNSDP